MKMLLRVSCLSIALFSFSGCVSRIHLKEPILFTPNYTLDIPKNIGIILADGAENYSITKGGLELFIGEAVFGNIGNSVKPLFQTVTVSTMVASLPPNVDRIVEVRISSGTELYFPATIFSDIKLTVALDFKVYDRTGKTLVWQTTSRGIKTGKQPPTIGFLTAGAINSFYRTLTQESVKASLVDLDNQISARRKELFGVE